METNSDIKKGRKFFFAVFLFLTLAVLWLIKDYWDGILLAFTTGLILHPYYEFLKRKFKLGSNVANSIVILTAFLFIFLPLMTVGIMLLRDAISLRSKIGENFNFADFNMDVFVMHINKYLSLIPFKTYQIDVQQLQELINNGLNMLSGFIINNLSGVVGSVTSIMLRIIMFFTLLAFLIPNFKKLSTYVKDLSPLSRSIDEQFIGKAKAMIIDMVKGTVVIGLVQSLIAGSILEVFGVEYILTLTVLIFIFSLIPVVGTSVITIPTGLIMILMGNTFAGITIILVQAIIISNVDNVLRPLLVSDKARINPVLVILSVIGGLSGMGILGVIYGPVIMILFVTAIDIYKKYYRE